MRKSLIVCFAFILLVSCKETVQKEETGRQIKNEKSVNTKLEEEIETSQEPSSDEIDIIDYYFTLPPKYFAFDICGKKDSKYERRQNIVEEDLEINWLSFEDECTGYANEFKKLYIPYDEKELFWLTVYEGNKGQSFYVLEHDSSNWNNITNELFVSKNRIRENITTALEYAPTDQKRFIQNIQDGTDIPYEFQLSDSKKIFNVVVSKEITNDYIRLAQITWDGGRFEISPSFDFKPEIKPLNASGADRGILVAAVLKDDGWQFIKPDGSLLLEDKFSFADNFSNGLACVSQAGYRMDNVTYGGIYNFIDVSGDRIDFEHDEPVRFHEGRAIYRKNSKYGFVDSTGTILITGFDQMGYFSEGLAPAVKRNLFGFLNRKGEWQFRVAKNLTFNEFKGGLSRAKKGKLVGYLNTSGAWQIPAKWQDAWDFSEKRAIVREAGKYGFIDQIGDLVIPLIYDDAGDFKDGLALVKKDGKFGFINAFGATIIDFKYHASGGFHEGLAPVQLNDGDKIGYINLNDEMVIAPKFDNGLKFENGIGMVEYDGKMGYIDRDGNFVIPAIYDRVNPFVYTEETNPMFRP